MPKTLIYLAILLLSLSRTWAQQGFRWAHAGGGSLHGESAMDLTTDAQGNIYLAAHFKAGTQFLDSSLTAAGGSDLIVAKLDPWGNLVWWDHRGSTADDRANQLAVDESGRVYMTGYGKLTFPRHTRDALTVVYEADGSLLWGRNMDGDQYSEGRGIAVGENHSVYMAGALKENGWYATGDSLIGHGGKDGYLVKFDSTGNYLWGFTLGGATDDEVWMVDTDTEGNVYVCGWFTGSADLGDVSNSIAIGSTDGFIAKFTSSGNFVWLQQFGGTQAESVRALKVADDGSIYFVGDFDGSFSTGAGTVTSQGLTDIFFGKIDPNGNLSWINHAGGPQFQYAQDLEIDPQENIYLGGLFFGYLAYDGDTVITGAYDNLYLMKMDSAGNILRLEDGYYTLESRGVTGLGVDAAQNAIIGGYFGQRLVLGNDTLQSSANTIDFFVAKYASLPFTYRFDSISGSPYCGSDRFQVHYTVEGMPDAANVFFVELSDVTGSFASPDTVGSSINPVGGNITCIVPSGLPTGTGYRVRMTSSSPNITTQDNGYDITLSSATSIPVFIQGDSVICNGVPVLLVIDTGFVSQVWSTGDTTAYLIATQPGTYWVEATDPFGCTNIDHHTLTPCVSIWPAGSPPVLEIYPNPAQTVVYIRTAPSAKLDYALMDLQGRQLKSGQLSLSGTTALDVERLPRGMYVLQAHGLGGAFAHHKILLR